MCENIGDPKYLDIPVNEDAEFVKPPPKEKRPPVRFGRRFTLGSEKSLTQTPSQRPTWAEKPFSFED